MATANIYDMADTWNNAGTTFTAIRMNVTDTASQAASLLIDLLVASASKFSVIKNGDIKVGGSNAMIGLDTNSGTNSLLLYANNTPSIIINITDTIRLGSDMSMGWCNNTNPQVAFNDTKLFRDGAAGVIAQRNSTNAQIFRLYRTFTDASNYERLALQSNAGIFEIAAETAGTGTDNIDVQLTPAGTGLVRFGTYTVSATVNTGYISIKDSGGTTRLIAIVSI